MTSIKQQVTLALDDVETASQPIIMAARKLEEAGRTIDANSSEIEQDLILKLYNRVSEAKELAANLDYIEPSDTSFTCLVA